MQDLISQEIKDFCEYLGLDVEIEAPKIELLEPVEKIYSEFKKITSEKSEQIKALHKKVKKGNVNEEDFAPFGEVFEKLVSLLKSSALYGGPGYSPKGIIYSSTDCPMPDALIPEIAHHVAEQYAKKINKEICASVSEAYEDANILRKFPDKFLADGFSIHQAVYLAYGKYGKEILFDNKKLKKVTKKFLVAVNYSVPEFDFYFSSIVNQLKADMSKHERPVHVEGINLYHQLMVKSAKNEDRPKALGLLMGRMLKEAPINDYEATLNWVKNLPSK